MEPIDAIAAYCSAMKIDDPVYTPCYFKKFKKYICSVIIDNKPYYTYPDEFDNENDAKIGAARCALMEIKHVMEDKGKYTVCTDSSEDIATKIFDIIDDNGRFLDSIPLAFQ